MYPKTRWVGNIERFRDYDTSKLNASAIKAKHAPSFDSKATEAGRSGASTSFIPKGIR
jgi:hypothetical protein